MKKRRQHHVWQHYLKPWTQAGALFCLSGDRVFATGRTVIAVETDFYRLHDLTEGEATFAFELVSQGIHPIARASNKRFLDGILAPMRFVRMHGDKLKVPQIDQMIDEYKSNVIEDYHANVEADFLPLIERLQNGDVSFFADDRGAIDLINYLCLQYLRTKPIKDRTLAALKTNVGLDLSKGWDLIAIMLATNAGGNVYLERKARTLSCIENGTGVDFLTSDQPVFNLHAATGQAADKLTLYYPVSPTRAVILSEQNEKPLFGTATLTRQHVDALNKIIVGASHSQVFGRSKESLAPYQTSQAA